MDEIRARLQGLMRDRGIEGDYAALAELTGDDRQQVRRWVVGEIQTIPADYIGRLEAAGVASARWLLRGIEELELVPPDEAAYKLAVIGRVMKSPISSLLQEEEARRSRPAREQRIGESERLEQAHRDQPTSEPAPGDGAVPPPQPKDPKGGQNRRADGR